ncbi:unnamed protein product [Soboliphyme baturini]|uniref:Integrator complex subunit 4 n=1 Tax=Soboliphyme baturini TaxID=241478 RepID=A0A183IJJ6_9BILA|nr:unnamed protein product [Soboliphyme baturini]
MYLKKREHWEGENYVPEEKVEGVKRKKVTLNIWEVLDQISNTSDSSQVFPLLSKIFKLPPLSTDDMCLALMKLLHIFDTTKQAFTRTKIASALCEIVDHSDKASCSTSVVSLIQVITDVIEQEDIMSAGPLIPLLAKLALLLNCENPLFQKVFSLLREQLKISEFPFIRISCLNAITQMSLKMKHLRRPLDIKPSATSSIDVDMDEGEADQLLKSKPLPIDTAAAAGADASEPEIESILFMFAADSDCHIRMKAVEYLRLYHDSGFRLSFENYGAVCKMLDDEFYFVRLNSLELLMAYASLYPENLVESLNKGTELRLTDDVFLRLSIAMHDEMIPMRTTAATLMGNMKNVSARFLEQMLDKQLMYSMLLSDAEFQEVFARSSTGYRYEPSIPMELIMVDSAFVIPQSCCGSFVLGLEDEHKGSNACVWSTCQLASQSAPFAQKSMNMLLDVFNDEIEEVRLTLIRNLSKPLLHVVLTEDQLEVIITALHNASSAIHNTICELLSNCRVYTPQCLQMALQAFVGCIKECPEKQESVFKCIRELGKNNANLVMCIMEELLGLHPFLDMPGTSLEDCNCTAKLILVFSAARYCPAMHSVMRRYALCHYDYLHTTPELVPLLKNSPKESGIGKSAGAGQANFPQLMKMLETLLSTCQNLPPSSRTVTLKAITRDSGAGEKFKYLGIVFPSDGKFEEEIDRRIGVASGVLRELARAIVTKAKLSLKTKLSMFKSIFTPILTYGQSWITTEKLRSHVQAAEMGFLRRVDGLTRLDMVRNTDVC